MARSQAVTTPFTAMVNGPVVVITGEYGVALCMTPEAVLESVAAMQAAAEEALRNRDAGVQPE